ncbi:MAG TPA: EamA family transporter [Gammaproteobacteria bacterium]|nr:EamA family transporter [Gammaproteobacteria bacterium]
MRPIDLLQVLAVVLIWGLNFVAIKTAVTEIPPLALTVLRFLLVGIILTPFFRPEKTQFKQLLLLSGTMGVGHFGLLFMGLRGADAATAALLIQLGVPFSSILAAFFFGDRLGWIRAAGMGMAFAGAGLLAGEPEGGTPVAIAALLVSAMCWAGSNILIKRIPQVHPLTLIGWLSLLAVPPLILMSLLVETDQLIAIRSADWKTWTALVYIVLASSIVACYLWYRLIGRLQVNQVVPFTLLAPVIGVAAGVWILGEDFTQYKAVGGGLTVAGVAVIQFRQMRVTQSKY